jgi:hypothetical protein
MSESENATAILEKFEPLLEDLTGYELTVLNKMIVERIHLINKANALLAFSTLKPGDHVSWKGSEGIIRKGIILKFNHKTVSVNIDEKSYCNVSPQLLKKIDQ